MLNKLYVFMLLQDLSVYYMLFAFIMYIWMIENVLIMSPLILF